VPEWIFDLDVYCASKVAPSRPSSAQCAAVTNTVEETSEPEQNGYVPSSNVPTSAPTYGWRFPSSVPYVIACAGPTKSAVAATASASAFFKVHPSCPRITEAKS
jgi:hypothetical protein